MSNGFIDGNDRRVGEGDEVEYRFGARRGRVVHVAHDGEADVIFFDTGKTEVVKWRNLCGVPPEFQTTMCDDCSGIGFNANTRIECRSCNGRGVAKVRKRLIDADSATRKTFPMARGLLDYFPDALAAVAQVSYIGNEKHNPGEPMHHARGKSTDHADCIMRHLVGRGGFDGDTRHSAALAWRALALLQEELEAEMNLSLPRGAR